MDIKYHYQYITEIIYTLGGGIATGIAASFGVAGIGVTYRDWETDRKSVV